MRQVPALNPARHAAPVLACLALLGVTVVFVSRLVSAPDGQSSVSSLDNIKESQVPPLRASSVTHRAGPTHEEMFFDALNRHPEDREAAVAAVRLHAAQHPDDARAALLLGVAHLWVVAENPPSRELGLEHLVLAHHHLGRAARLNPGDDRIPSWLLSAEISLAQAEGRDAEADASLALLRVHAERDPCFHSVAFAINVWDQPRDSSALAEAQRLLEAAAACNTDDPSVRNMERWPHNVQGFLVGLSDVALKRGDRSRALAALVAAEAWPGSDVWPHRREALERRHDFDARAARFADDDPENDPAFIFERGGPVSCLACHQGQDTERGSDAAGRPARVRE